MNSLTVAKLFLVLSYCLLSAEIVNSQNPPSDFKVVATAGGIMPGSEIRSIYIQPNGVTIYSRYKSNDPASDPLDYQQFILTTEQLGQIWQAIQTNAFFSLAKGYSNPKISDRTYASLAVTANSLTYIVWTQNVAVQPFDNIINKINSVILPSYKLIYNISEIPVFEQIDICDQEGSKSIYYLSKPTKDNPLPNLQIKPKSTKSSTTYAHPGTFVSYEMSLQRAVRDGYASVSSKGSYWGDVVSISASNDGTYSSNTVKEELFIEFYGEGATHENIQVIEDAIEIFWSSRTTEGKTFEVDVVTRISDSNTPPGTPGYHQIELVNAPESEFVSGVNGVGTDFGVNSGVTSGGWSTLSETPERTYAHEAGHLMGLPDQSIAYEVQDDGNWKSSKDNNTYTSDDLAQMYYSYYNDLAHKNCPSCEVTEADLKAWLEKPDVFRLTPPEAGHENDIMGEPLMGFPLQSDIDQIASKAGLVIDIQPGDILINKYDYEQNIAITHSEHLFLQPGESKQLEGLYGACIDLHKHIPSYDWFDVSPNVSYWSNIDDAGYLYQLLTYIDENDFYCEDNFDYQNLIWRISDNDFDYDRSLDTNLLNAGINIGDRILDIPKIYNPFSYSSGSYYLIPRELYTIGLYASPGFIVHQPQFISIDAKILVLIWDDIVSDFTWKLEKPTGSTSQLSSSIGNSVNFSPDKRGFYRLSVEASFTDLMNLSTVLNDSKLMVLADDYTETFETGNLSSSPPFEWINTNQGKWEISNEYLNTGIYSLCSGRIGNSETSEISLDMVVNKNDSVFFSYKVSSEDSYDCLRFYIDGILIYEWSGESDWDIAKFPIQQGNHTLKWAYEKDMSYSEGADRCWIDDIFLPNSAVTQVEKSLSINNYKAIAYPNPVEKYLTLKYLIESKEKISISLYDITGRLIKLLNDDYKEPGIQTETYNLEGISNGLYVIKIQNNENRISSSVFINKE
ncbi:MAG: T9SS type A sorting domain-containing protein [Bacteroidales bacterium]|nr:T9SS type A sorting domain-containing protein [Bacteroidales bacterium]